MNENNRNTTIKLALFETRLIEAAHAVIDNESNINKINYFPVSDKDTGTNMATTLEMLIADYTSSRTFDECLDKVSEIVFDNARGNSGILLSIWMSGMNKLPLMKDEITPREFLRMFESANGALRKHLGDFMPGTMVSFLQAFVADLERAFEESISDIEERLEWVRHQLKQHLHQTMEDNPALKPHGVVDSGALGMYFFTSTLISHLADGETSIDVKAHHELSNEALLQQHEAHQTHHHAEPPTSRYCTEAKLVIDDANLDEAKRIITSHGDCDLFLKRGKKLRFHVHCNHPQKLFGELMEIAEVKAPKVEDMLRQYQASTHQKKIALLADTSADLSEELLEKYHIHLIPLSILMGNHEALDVLGIEASALYKNINDRGLKATTATPKMGYVKRILEFLKATHDEVLVITLSSNMSGTYDVVSKLSEGDEKIRVFDSKTTAGALGWLVAKAGELIEAGEPMDSIYLKLLQYRDNPSIYAAVDSLASMVASGRVSALKGRIAQAVHMKPIISISDEGRGIIYDKSFSRQASHKKLLNIVKAKNKKNPIKQYSVLHVNEDKLAANFAKELEAMLKMPPKFIKPISTVIGLHIGQGALVVAVD